MISTKQPQRSSTLLLLVFMGALMTLHPGAYAQTEQTVSKYGITIDVYLMMTVTTIELEDAAEEAAEDTKEETATTSQVSSASVSSETTSEVALVSTTSSSDEVVTESTVADSAASDDAAGASAADIDEADIDEADTDEADTDQADTDEAGTVAVDTNAPFTVTLETHLELTDTNAENLDDADAACGEIQQTWVLNQDSEVVANNTLGRQSYTIYFTPCNDANNNTLTVSSKQLYIPTTGNNETQVDGASQSTGSEGVEPQVVSNETSDSGSSGDETTQGGDTTEEEASDFQDEQASKVVYTSWDSSVWLLSSEPQLAGSIPVEDGKVTVDQDTSKWHVTGLTHAMTGNNVWIKAIFEVTVTENCAAVRKSITDGRPALLYTNYYRDPTKPQISEYHYYVPSTNDIVPGQSGARQLTLAITTLVATIATISLF